MSDLKCPECGYEWGVVSSSNTASCPRCVWIGEMTTAISER